MPQICVNPLLSEQEILRLGALCEKLAEEKERALREMFGSRYEYESKIVRLRKEIDDLNGVAGEKSTSLLYERQAYKKDIMGLELSVQNLSDLNSSLDKELLDVKAKLFSALAQDSRLEQTVKRLGSDRQRLWADLDYARQVIRENHDYALELEVEHYKCKVCRKRYEPKRPCLFDGVV